MWQRKQTVFLLCALVFTILCLCLPLLSIEPKGMGVSSVLYNLFLKDGDGNMIYGKVLLFVFLLITVPIAIAAILLFKNRKRQIMLCQWCIIFNLAWYVYLAFCFINEFMVSGTPHLNVSVAFPFFSIVFYILAIRGIRADEKLIRAADRIR